MIVKKSSAGSNPDNAIQFNKNLGVCCGDTPGVQALCSYEVSVASSTTVSGVTIEAVAHTFASPINSKNTQALQDAIVELVDSLGYRTTDIAVAISGSNTVISIPRSELEFNSVQASSGTAAFTPTCIARDPARAIQYKAVITWTGDTTTTNDTVTVIDINGVTNTPGSALDLHNGATLTTGLQTAVNTIGFAGTISIIPTTTTDAASTRTVTVFITTTEATPINSGGLTVVLNAGSATTVSWAAVN